MANDFQKSITFNFKDILIEEISLEGLVGIACDLLWRRISMRISSPVTEKMQLRFWNLILKFDCISIYKNPEPMPHIEVLDRFAMVDEDSGDLKEPEDYLDGPYEYQPIENDYGSCVYYKQRSLLSKKEIAKRSYEDVISEYGNRLVLVASKQERWAALAPYLPISFINQLTPIHYCILELIGKSRENGQMTIGKTNLTKIIKDSKLLFYNRKVLQELDLIRVTYLTHVSQDKGAIKSILLRLKKYHKSLICTIPKTGLIHNLVEYLKEQPNYCEKTEVILRKGLLSQKLNKRYQKKFYIFGFEEKPIEFDKITPAKKKPKPHTKRRYIYLCSQSDESSESEEEDNGTPLVCQYKVGVNILRQAYERFLEAGLSGLTQVELSQLLGLEFYLSRTICRAFRGKNLVREFLEDKGRQRTARFIAVAATAKKDSEYLEELDKFQKHLEEYSAENANNGNENDTDEDPIPKKKRRLEQKDGNIENMDMINEVNVIEGLLKVNFNTSLSDSAKKMTLRQLKFANGILKIVRTQGIVIGFLTMSKLVSEEIEEPPMDTKALKTLLQKLMADKYIKIFVIKWPGIKDRSTTLICAPNIKRTDPAVRTLFKDIMKKAVRNKDSARKKLSVVRPLTQYAFPRYIKMKKLHEAVVKYAYFDPVKRQSNDLPQGFIYIKDLILELTIEVALGNISSAGSLDIVKFKIDDSLLNVKICDAPLDLSKTLANSTHLYNSIRSILKVLSLFGLVQMIAQGSQTSSNIPDNTLAIHLIYVNRHAKLIDTSGVWPKVNVPIQNFEKRFHFETFEDVEDYWSAVYNIGTNTTIDVPNRNLKKQPKVPIHLMSEVGHHDNGQQYGDLLGPCGFDSCFYLDLPRLWNAYSARSNTIKTKMTKKLSVKIPKFDKPKRTFKRVRKPKQKKATDDSRTIEKLSTVTRAQMKKAMLRKSLMNVRRKKPATPISWCQEEDRVVMMCRAAVNIMSPIPQPGSLQIRNLVTKDILSLRDPKKTQKICHRRAGIVDCNSTMLYEKDCVLADVKRNHAHIIKKYEGTLKKLRILHSTNMTRYLHSARVPMFELVWLLLQVLKSTCLKQNIPESFEQLQQDFTIVPSSSNRPSNSYKSDPFDVTMGPLKEAIILTVMLSFNNVVDKSSAEKIFHNFDRYEERTLRSAVDDLRKCGAVAAKQKILNGLMHKINLDDIVHCWYKISVQYQRKWSVKLNTEFSTEIANCFGKPLVENNLKGTSEINCFCCEMLTNGVIDIAMITAPVVSGFTGSIIQEDQLNTFEIDNKYKLKAGTLGWKTQKEVEKLSDIYNHIDVEGPLETLFRRSVIKLNEGGDMENEKSDIEKIILKYLEARGEKGASFQKLKEIGDCETKTLIELLQKMESNNVINCVGIYENLLVLNKYVEKWLMVVNDQFIRAKPWLTVDLNFRRDIFLKWASVVMTKIFEYPGSTLTYISDSCEFLSTTAVQDICEVLLKWECVTLHTIIVPEISLFSVDDEEIPNMGEYNVYESPQSILAFPVPDSLVKFSYLKSKVVLVT